MNLSPSSGGKVGEDEIDSVDPEAPMIDYFFVMCQTEFALPLALPLEEGGRFFLLNTGGSLGWDNGRCPKYQPLILLFMVVKTNGRIEYLEKREAFKR